MIKKIKRLEFGNSKKKKKKKKGGGGGGGVRREDWFKKNVKWLPQI